MPLTVHATPPCRYCGTVTRITLDREAVARLADGQRPSAVFPFFPLADIALIAEGTHPECATLAVADATACHSTPDTPEFLYPDKPA